MTLVSLIFIALRPNDVVTFVNATQQDVELTLFATSTETADAELTPIATTETVANEPDVGEAHAGGCAISGGPGPMNSSGASLAVLLLGAAGCLRRRREN